MVNYSSIKYISSLLNHPETITAGDQSSIALFRQTFPYFVPVRYLSTVEMNKMKPWSTSMLSEMYPYMGDWILFCDFLENGNKAWNGEVKSGPVPVNKVLDKKKVEVAPRAEHTEIKKEVPPPAQAATEASEIPAAPAQEPPISEKEQPVPMTGEMNEPKNEPVIAPVALPAQQEKKHEAAEHTTGEPAPIFAQVIELLQESEKPEEEPQQPEIAAEAVAEEDQLENEDLQPIVIGIEIEPTEAIELAITEDGEQQTEDAATEDNKDPLISPVYTQDYFLQQGEKVSEELPDEIDDLIEKEEETDEDKSLMVMMSFSEWLLHFKNTSQKQQEERKDQKALKTMWQKEKLAAALEEENEEIPENVFQMAVTSITKEEGLASETLAEVYIKQGKFDQAIEMYRKLSLRNPQKSTYFARKIEEILKEK